MRLYEISYCNHAGVPSIIHVNAESSEQAREYFESTQCDSGELFYSIREGASSSRPGVPCITVPAGWQAETVTAAAETGSEDKPATAPAPVRLADLIPYRSKITVYVPSTVNVNEASDNSAQVERVARLLSECFGGATASPASGYWVAADKSLVVEHTTMVFAYCDTVAAEKYIDDVVRLCYSLKIEMGQEAIALEYNGEMYFI